jgi:hypothetical protein
MDGNSRYEYESIPIDKSSYVRTIDNAERLHAPYVLPLKPVRFPATLGILWYVK